MKLKIIICLAVFIVFSSKLISKEIKNTKVLKSASPKLTIDNLIESDWMALDQYELHFSYDNDFNLTILAEGGGDSYIGKYQLISDYKIKMQIDEIESAHDQEAIFNFKDNVFICTSSVSDDLIYMFSLKCNNKFGEYYEFLNVSKKFPEGSIINFKKNQIYVLSKKYLELKVNVTWKTEPSSKAQDIICSGDYIGEVNFLSQNEVYEVYGRTLKKHSFGKLRNFWYLVGFSHGFKGGCKGGTERDFRTLGWVFGEFINLKEEK